eukprot:2659315-Pyramimonas_sp.AAC.1
MIGPVGLPSYESQWLLKYSDKKDLYGPMRVATGGAQEIPDAGAPAKKRRLDTDYEPSSWHTMIDTISSEFIHSYPEAFADAPAPSCLPSVPPPPPYPPPSSLPLPPPFPRGPSPSPSP